MKHRAIFLILALIIVSNLYSQEKGVFNLLPENIIQNGLDFEIAYTSEVFSNLSGGIQKKTCYIDNFDLLMNMNLQKLTGLKNSGLVFYLLGNNGEVPSDFVGAIQGVSNIATAPAWKLYQAYFHHTLFDEKFSYTIGLYDLNAEYDTRETSALFINPAHGIGTDYAQSGCNGPSIFPNAGLSLSLNLKFSEHLLLRTGIFEGIPNNPSGLNIEINKTEGVLIASEINLEYGDFSELDEYFARYAVGFWYYTAEFEGLSTTNNNEFTKTINGSFGLYAFVEKMLFSFSGNKGLAGFLRFGLADKSVNKIENYLGGGLVYYGLFNENDEVGIAVASARNNDRCRSLLGLDAYETNFEFTYRTEITNWLSVQPDIQYVINPSAESSIKNSLVVGTRVQLSL